MPLPRLHRAITFATKAHKGQDRDGPSPLPYITHPLDVLNLVRYVGGETREEVLCAAVLHDVLEETDACFDRLLEKFGIEVADLVAELTRVEPSEEQVQNLGPDELYELRNRQLLNEIRAMSASAMKIKLADRSSNLLSGREFRTGLRMDRYLTQSREILQIIPRNTCPPLWDLLRSRINLR